MHRQWLVADGPKVPRRENLQYFLARQNRFRIAPFQRFSKTLAHNFAQIENRRKIGHSIEPRSRCAESSCRERAYTHFRTAHNGTLGHPGFLLPR
jgi:hypothetical protein